MIPLQTNLQNVLRDLKCNEIIALLESANIDKIRLLTLIIESKINYDIVMNDPECSLILEEMNEHNVYENNRYQSFIIIISNLALEPSNAEVEIEMLLLLRHFHLMLIKTFNIVIKLLKNNRNGFIPINSNLIVNPIVEIVTSESVSKNEEGKQVIKKVISEEMIDKNEEPINLSSFLKTISYAY